MTRKTPPAPATSPAARDWTGGGNRTLLSEHAEVESGKTADRSALAKALRDCKPKKAPPLIAKSISSPDTRTSCWVLRRLPSTLSWLMPSASRPTVRLKVEADAVPS